MNTKGGWFKKFKELSESDGLSNVLIGTPAVIGFWMIIFGSFLMTSDSGWPLYYHQKTFGFASAKIGLIFILLSIIGGVIAFLIEKILNFFKKT